MAESGDSLEFHARYNGWSTSRVLDAKGCENASEVAAYLISVREEVAGMAFEVLGIDLGVLEAYAEKAAKSAAKGDYASIVAIYKLLGTAETENEIGKAVRGKEELKPFAKAYMFRTALKRIGLEWYITRDSMRLGNTMGSKAGTSGFQSSGIFFMAKYRDWIAIKKLSVSSDTKPEEVAAQLSSIRLATDRRIPQVLGVNTDSLDMYAATVTDGMRKSAANLEKITTVLCSDDAKKQIDGALAQNAPREAAVIYLFSKMLQNIRVDLEVSPETLMDMFPGLKIPKPKGRMPGQKKKK